VTEITDTTTNYKPGDIVNGHVLTEQGWVPTAPAPAPKAKKPIYKRWWAIGLAAIFVIGGISVAAGGSDDGKADVPQHAAAQTAPKVEMPKAEQPAEEAAPQPEPAPQPQYTVSQENAIESAESYLDMSGFSRAGLIDQLSSQYGEGFPTADAVFAVNHIDVDWNAQAVKSAKSYLDMGGFSRAGLIDQLSSPYGEQFTVAQATYAANKVGL
jgi:hypothetical protein